MNEPYKMLIKNPNSGKGHYYIYCSIQNYSTLKEPKKKKNQGCSGYISNTSNWKKNQAEKWKELKRSEWHVCTVGIPDGEKRDKQWY